MVGMTTMYPLHLLLFHRAKRTRVWFAVILCCLFFILVAPKIPHSPKHHAFADMRNFLGVPNTLNVITNFPFLIVGVLGLVLSLQGSFFVTSLPGEVWGWVLFYAGIAGTAYGSAYYHLKPSDDRVTWDRFPMMVSYASLLSNLILERMGVKIGVACLISFLMLAVVSIACESLLQELR